MSIKTAVWQEATPKVKKEEKNALNRAKTDEEKRKNQLRALRGTETKKPGSSGTGTAAAGSGSGAGSAGQNGAVQSPRETKKNDISQQQEYAWQRKYAGKSSTDLQNIALGLDDGEEKGSFDLEAGQSEIDAMEEQLALLRRQKNTAIAYGSAPYAAGQGSAAAYGMPYAAAQQGGDDIDTQIRELEKQISEKERYLNTAKSIQRRNALASASGNADFGQYSGYVSTVDTQGGTVDETYEWINNRNGYREQYEADRAERYKTQNTGYGAAGPSSAYTSTGYGAGQQAGIDRPVPDSEYEQKGYDYLKEEEIAIYNYYYAKEGKEKAQQYLDSIQEKLNQRKAEDMFAEMEGNTAAEIAFGIASGAENFAYGMKSLFNFDGEYVPVSAFQYAGEMAREDLADDSIGIWYNFKEKKWEDNILGNSLGQIAYDTVNTTANMVPSILAATAANIIVPGSGAWVGSALMGMSAGGNAYQQALNEGFDKDEARMYGIMVGASEMIMEKFVGGIEKFGGNAAGKFFVRNMGAADKALKMVAKQIGSMASEFTEEYLQTVLEPVLQNIILDTDHEVEFLSPEALYAGILGALTAAVMQGPSHVGGAVRTTGSEKNPVAAGSEPSAAGGRRSEVSDCRRSGVQASNRPAGAALSESQWQRSKKSGESVSPKIFSGTATGRSVLYERTIGKEPSPEAVANRMAAVVSEDSGAFTMGSLFGELGGELTRQNVSDITEALIEEGMDERTARKNARILWYVVKNGPVSRAQAQMIEGNDILAKVMREVIIDPYCTVDPQSIGYNEILRRLARETVARESGYHFGMWNPSPAGSTAGGAGGRVWMSQGGDNAAAAAFVPQGEGFGSGWQETRGASAERNGAKLEAAQGAGADALDAGSSFEQRQAENLTVEEFSKHDRIGIEKFNTTADPMREVTGAGLTSHPKEISRILSELKAFKVEVIHRGNSMAYAPALSPGMAGQFMIDEEASYSAWMHEYKHFCDDRDDGFLGMRVFQNTEKCIKREIDAYDVEIEMARQAGRLDIVDRLEVLKAKEVSRFERNAETD